MISLGKFYLLPASEADQAQARAAYEAYRPLLEAQVGVWDAQAQHQRFQRVWDPQHNWMVYQAETAIGYMQWEQRDFELTLEELVIASAYQGQGAAAAVLGYLKSLSPVVKLSVWKQNPAVGLYRKHGFEVIGEDEVRLKMQWQEMQ